MWAVMSGHTSRRGACGSEEGTPVVEAERMRVSVIGTGYLGATTAACLAEMGYEVMGLDVDEAKIDLLRSGKVPFYEPGLAELLTENLRTGRLHFTTDFAEVAAFADLHLICVGTPQRDESGAADLKYVNSAIDSLAPHLTRPTVVVGRSTVPVGTAATLAARLPFSLRALGQDVTRVRAVIYQFVTLLRAGQQVKMSTRRAEYVTLDELLAEVGADVARFLFLTRKADTHLEFDLDLAKKQSMENPVYYVQYAHARIANILQRAASVGLEEGPPNEVSLHRLVRDDEMALVRRIVEFPDVVADAADELEPHRLTFYLLELAAAFHGYYNRPENRVVGEDVELSRARLALVACVRQVVRSGLGILGVGAPERM